MKFLESLSLGGSFDFCIIENILEPAPPKVDTRSTFLGYEYLRMKKLPDYQQFYRDITSITLGSCELEEDPMPTLEKLLKLRVLCMRWNAFTWGESVSSREGFPPLSYLFLFILNNLEERKMEEGGLISNIWTLSIAIN